MSIDYFLAQARNNAWANATLFKAVTTLPRAAYDAEYPSFFGTIPRTLNHIHEVDLFYIDALTRGGKGRAIFQREDIDDPQALAAAQAASDGALMAFCATLTDTDLPQTVTVGRSDGPSHERIDHLLLHLFQHQIHHRGQVHALLSQTGAEPPQLDDFYLVWGRVETAKPYWEDTAP
ncbi:nuclease [Rhodophyticola sp. CCM32]|uniref:DinB family protein n=1 Tax=Rhodophyticola sp. CCM32 TaxID=2916397 RepID=UPI00107FB40C|nr:DinB family protein [Rhodophyticola sp. CCM32]QBX99443.1 nuclease [Rhodophyticola sp. CCM32]